MGLASMNGGLASLLHDMVQVAYVTDDLDAATAHLESSLGVAPFHVNRGASLGGSIRVGGVVAEEWVIDAALSYAGSTNIEVIRPVSGQVELYRAGIRPGALLTVHHLGFRVDDFERASNIVERAGRSWAQHGDFGDIRFGYLDMVTELGHFVEVMEIGPQAAAYFRSLQARATPDRSAS